MADPPANAPRWVHVEPYSPSHTCPTCGSDEIGVEYHESLHEAGCVASCGFDRFADECREHFDRRCRRCRTTWIEGLPDVVEIAKRAGVL